MQLDTAFFEEEERCGYTVSAEMKKIWAVEIDLLQKLTEVCKKHGLSFFASDGTMLGAARHQGFIPWDDDIDVTMLRSDYDKLCEIAPEEFGEPYFFQTHFNDVNYNRGHAQLRNSNTTGILSYELGKRSFNQGIFIDIFPLDNIPDTDELALHLQKQILFCRRILSLTVDYDLNTRKSKAKDILHKILTPLVNPTKVYKQYMKYSTSYNKKNCKRVGPISCLPEFAKRYWVDAENYKKTVELPFEYITVPVPERYDEMLTAVYGDWRTPCKAPTMHGDVIFDTEKSYKEYLNK